MGYNRKERVKAVANARIERHNREQQKRINESRSKKSGYFALDRKKRIRVIKKKILSAKKKYELNQSLIKQRKERKQKMVASASILFIIFAFVVFFGSYINQLTSYETYFYLEYNSIDEITESFVDVDLILEIGDYFSKGLISAIEYIKNIGKFAQLIIDTIGSVVDFVTAPGSLLDQLKDNTYRMLDDILNPGIFNWDWWR